MSVSKVVTVQKSRKDQGTCGKCGDLLPAGTGYLYWTMGFRSNYKHKRCLKAACFPRPSERETSKFVAILSAQESFSDALDTMTDKDEIESAVQEVGSAVREVCDEYQEALNSWENGNESLQEKVDHYESQADEVENWTWDGNEEPDLCDEHEESDRDDQAVQECDDCNLNRENWLEEIREAAREAVDNIEQA